MQGSEAEWDVFVERHPCGDLAQTAVWAATKRAIGQQSQLVLLRANDRIRAGAMLVTRSMAAGMKVGYCARGPLAEPGVDPNEIIEATMEAARASGVLLLLLQPAPGDDVMDKALSSSGGFSLGCPSVAPEATIRLDLSRTEEELLSGMSEMRRRNIRKALRSDLDVREDTDVETFQSLHASTAERQGFVAIDTAAMRAQWSVLAPTGRTRILLARHNGIAVAGIWLSSFNGVVTFKFAGWNAASDGSRNANEALHWTAIRWARSIGARSYDLGGFDRQAAETLQAGGELDKTFQKTPGYFKLGFGGAPMLLPRARWNYLGPARPLMHVPIQWALGSKRFHKLAGRLRNG